MPSGTQKEDLIALIDKIKDNTKGDLVSGADIIAALGRRSFGPFLIITGLLATLPTGLIPGMTLLTGTVMLILFGQLLIGAQEVWLPGIIKRRALPRDRLIQGLDAIRGAAERVGRVAGPRFEFLLRAPFVQIVAISGIIMGLTMYPLAPIPFGAFPGGISAIVIGIGLAVRDGVFIAAGIALGVFGVALPFWLF